MVTAENVSRFPGLAALPVAELERVAAQAVRRRGQKGEVLFHEGDLASCVTLVEQGLVKLLKHGPSERSTLLEVARPPAVLDEAALHDQGRHHVTAVCLTDTIVMQLPVQDFTRVLARSPEALLDVVGALSEDVRRLTERAADLGEAGVERRLGQTLCRLCGHDCGAELPTEPADIPVPLSRQDIADMVGTSVETAIRILSKWSRKGMVRSTADGLQVLDCKGLKAVITAPPRLQKRA